MDIWPPHCRGSKDDACLFQTSYIIIYKIKDLSRDFLFFADFKSYNYNYDTICRAAYLVQRGARLIGCNSDITAPTEEGLAPDCGDLIAPIEMATGGKAYFIGKLNPLMMRTGLKLLGAHSQDAAIIGDRMDTDMIAGIETGLDTLLVLSGVTSRKDMERFPYQLRLILNGVGEIPPSQ